MKTKKLIIEIPDNSAGLADNIIKKAALMKRATQRANAQRGQAVDPVDDKLSDEKFLATVIRNEILTSYTEAAKREAAVNAAKQAADEAQASIREALGDPAQE